MNNPYFPLTPGTTTLFKGLLEGAPEKVRTTVTHDRKMIDGVSTMVVFDRVFVNGALKEKTYDYYAQDKVGNVWYFGEDTKEYENGVVVSTHGTFEAGVDGAKAGIIMPARPDTGLFYNEENAVGVAQDQAKVIGVHQTAKTHFGTFGDCIMTENTTPLDPTAKEQKYYAAGFGPVYSQDISGGQDILRLVSITFEK